MQTLDVGEVSVIEEARTGEGPHAQVRGRTLASSRDGAGGGGGAAQRPGEGVRGAPGQDRLEGVMKLRGGHWSEPPPHVRSLSPSPELPERFIEGTLSHGRGLGGPDCFCRGPVFPPLPLTHVLPTPALPSVSRRSSPTCCPAGLHVLSEAPGLHSQRFPGGHECWAGEGTVARTQRWARDQQQCPCIPSLPPRVCGRHVVPWLDGVAPGRSGPSTTCPALHSRRPRSPPPPRHAARLCLTALWSMRDDPDPTVSCLATQTCYVVEAKEKCPARRPPSCFCCRLPWEGQR